MFARLDFPRFLVCCSGDLSDDESEENLLLQFVVGPSVY